MPRLFVLGLVLLAACETPEKGPAAVDAAVTVETAETADSGASVDAASFTPIKAEPVGPGGTYAERCNKMSAAMCAHLQNCCAQTSAGCVEDLVDECLSPGKFKGLAAAATAGKLVLDAKLTANCDAALAKLAQGCNQAAIEDAWGKCLFSWTDPAPLGGACADGKGEACGGGKGRCVNVNTADPSVTLPTCVTSTAVGEACGSGKASCELGAICGAAAKKPQCFAYGTLCGTFGDVAIGCPGAQTCQGGTCVDDPGAGAGQPCKVSGDCRLAHKCEAGACLPLLCSKLPGK